jgi:hypothetical protein
MVYVLPTSGTNYLYFSRKSSTFFLTLKSDSISMDPHWFGSLDPDPDSHWLCFFKASDIKCLFFFSSVAFNRMPCLRLTFFENATENWSELDFNPYFLACRISHMRFLLADLDLKTSVRSVIVASWLRALV